MFQLDSFKSDLRVMGNGINNSKSLREKLISSIDKEIKVVNMKVNDKGENWYILEKFTKKINGVDSLVNENRFWRYDKEIGKLVCQLKLRGISFKYGELLNKRQNYIYEVELDENGDNILLWLNEMKDKLMSMDDSDEIFVSEENNNKIRRNQYRKKVGLELVV